MFNDLFEDLPIGKMILNYKTEVADYRNKSANIRKKLEQQILYSTQTLQILDEMDARLEDNNGSENEELEYLLTPRGTHFYNNYEEQDYNRVAADYARNLNNLQLLNLEYTAEFTSIVKNQNDELVTTGPIRYIPSI